MLVVYGAYFIGRTVRVTGVLSVRTRFLHFCYVPLVPRSSSVFVSQEARDATGFVSERFELHRIHWRSAILAWFRFALLFVLFASLVVLTVQVMIDAPAEKLARYGTLPAIALLAYWLSYCLDRATAEQLEALLRDGSDVPLELVRTAAKRLG